MCQCSVVPTSFPNSNPKKLRRVKFGAFAEVATFNNKISHDEREAIWYNDSELRHFKRSARIISRTLRNCTGSDQELAFINNAIMSEEDWKCLRGLELRMSKFRGRKSLENNLNILHAQARFTDPEGLAHFAQAVNCVATQIARITGSNDYRAVYDSNSKIDL